MKPFVVAFCGVLFAAAPAFAEPTGTAGSSPNSAAAPESASHGETARVERQICRRIESGTSRRIGSRLVCHTAQEWREIQDGS